MTTDALIADELLHRSDGRVLPAGPDDCVDGVAPQWVARPQNTAQVSTLLAIAHRHRLAVVPRGSGARLDWGNPPERLELVLDLSALDDLVEHAAGDLIAVVGAGRTLTALAADLQDSHQRLAVDPPRPGTVGGAIAAALSGPSRLRHGPIRDLLIGVTVVRADGVVAHSGGKVVKNVAGYDLGKLMTGSFGTLGVITQAAFRLHPTTPTRRWLVTELPDAAALDRVQELVQSQLVPSGLELHRAAEPGGAVRTHLAVLIEADPSVLAARTSRFKALLVGADESETAPDWWGAEPAADPGTALGLKLTFEIARLPQLLAAVRDAEQAAATAITLTASPGVGVALAGIDSRIEPPRFASLVQGLRLRGSSAGGFGGSVTVLQAPSAHKAAVDVWGPVPALSLMRRVKEQFDPGRILAPGRFVGGI